MLITRQQRLRRVAILCCHFLRNLAFYEAGWERSKLIFNDQFWVNVNSNFLDVAVMEWCKLFGDKKGQHSWEKVIKDQPTFLSGLLHRLDKTQCEFDSYVVEMKTYRDKFIAHLDAENVMYVPKLGLARDTVLFLYEYLRSNEEENNCFDDAPVSAMGFYEKFFTLGRAKYST